MNLQRGPIPVLTLCAPEHAIKNYNRGLLSIYQSLLNIKHGVIGMKLLVEEQKGDLYDQRRDS